MRKIRFAVLKSLLIKEFIQILRDKRMVMMLFGSPILMLLLFGYAVNTDVTSIKTGVVDEDKTSASRKFIEKFSANRYFIYASYGDSSDRMSASLDRGEIEVMIHIRKGFSIAASGAGSSDVQMIIDGTDSSRASVVVFYVNAIMNSFLEPAMRAKAAMVLKTRAVKAGSVNAAVNIRERALFNPELTSRNFFLPGVIGLLIALITIMLTAMSVVKERESGTIEQIIVSPLLPVQFIAGKTIPFAIIGFIEIAAVTVLTIAWFDVPFNGSFLFLLFSGICFIVSTLAVGLYISTVSRTQQQAMLSSFLFFLPAILFSGFVFPIYAMPEPVQLVTYLNPLSYFIKITRGIFLKGIGFEYLWKDLAGLALLGFSLLTLSVMRFSRRFE